MAEQNILENLIYGFCRKLLAVDEIKSTDIGKPRRILIVRPHNQLGDLLTGVSLLRAAKETFPDSHLTLIVSPFNYPGVVKNKYIDRLFIFDKKKIYNPSYLSSFLKLLREEYDLAVVPVTVSISFTSNLIARIANAKIRIGPRTLDGMKNKSAFLFDRLVNIDWRKHPDSNVAERSLDIVRPFGINTGDYRSEISFDENDVSEADKFITSNGLSEGEKLIGLHVGAGKIPNRWSLNKYVELMKIIKNNFQVKFYLTGSSADKNELDYVIQKCTFEVSVFKNKRIPEVAALISKSDLFISNDTGIMHVAGTTSTPQISIFGPTNPFNWAPIGENKYFVRRSELIDDVSVDDVYDLCEKILIGNGKEIKLA